MPEMFYTTEAIASDPNGQFHSPHNRRPFFRCNQGPAIGHVSPEAVEGGPIALVEDNNLIEIDINNRSLNIVGINGEKKRVQR